jgi:membrane protease YdiL (CAAX protease family)
MTAPFPSGLAARTARRQSLGLLVLFYGIVYGGSIFVGSGHSGTATPILLSILLGALMLLAVTLFTHRDASWRESLGLDRQPIGSTLRWSLLGFVGTYGVNIALSSAYLALQGDLEAVVAHRATWLGNLAELRVELILPLAAFVAVWEETVFRGFLLGRLRASMPAKETRGAALRRDVVAIMITALCFGAGHGYQGVLGLVQTTAAGAVLGALAIWRKSIWPTIGAHLAIDAFGLLALKALESALHTTLILMAIR